MHLFVHNIIIILPYKPLKTKQTKVCCVFKIFPKKNAHIGAVKGEQWTSLEQPTNILYLKGMIGLECNM